MSHLEVFSFTGRIFTNMCVTLLTRIGKFNPIRTVLLLQLAAAALYLGHADKRMEAVREECHT